MRPIKLLIGICFLAGMQMHVFSQENAVAYPNPYDTPDSLKPIKVNPFKWIDFSVGITNSKTIKEAYKQALLNNDGYKLVQLAKIEFDNVYTYGNLVPSKMLLEAYNIAIHNKDPFLAFWVLDFDAQYNLFSLVTPKEMVNRTHELALERKEPAALYALADLEEHYKFRPEITPKSIKLQALFINNKNHAPYANPYDNPDPSKSLDRTPFLWSDFPSHIDTFDEMNEAYKDALKNKDGYKLLQLSKIVFTNNSLSNSSIEDILQQSYDIAKYNRDPYLMIHLSDFIKTLNLNLSMNPSEIFRNAYNTAIERRDSDPLYFMYSIEKEHNFLPEIKPKNIFIKAIKLDESKEKPLLYEFHQ